jgi:hypothetical protein
VKGSEGSNVVLGLERRQPAIRTHTFDLAESIFLGDDRDYGPGYMAMLACARLVHGTSQDLFLGVPASAVFANRRKDVSAVKQKHG